MSKNFPSSPLYRPRTVKGVRMVWEFGGSTHSIRTSTHFLILWIECSSKQGDTSLSERGIWTLTEVNSRKILSTYHLIEGKFLLCHVVAYFSTTYSVLCPNFGSRGAFISLFSSLHRMNIFFLIIVSLRNILTAYHVLIRSPVRF